MRLGPRVTAMSEPEIKTVDLIKVQTIKRKHVEQIIDSFYTDAFSTETTEFLGYIPAFDAILARRADNGHLTAIRVISFVMSQIHNATEPDDARAAAHDR